MTDTEKQEPEEEQPSSPVPAKKVIGECTALILDLYREFCIVFWRINIVFLYSKSSNGHRKVV